MLNIKLVYQNIFEVKLIFLCFILFFLVACQGSNSKPRPQTKSQSIPLVVTKSNSSENIISMEQDSDKINDLEKKILLLQAQLDINSRLIDSNYVNNDQLRIFNEKYKATLMNLENNEMEQDYLTILNRMQQKIEILEDRTFYTDSLYFEIMTDMVMIENKISSLLLSFQEINDLGNKKSINIIPKITDEEYTEKYIEALADYQNAEWDKSLSGFGFLIHSDANHDLADNCQYWIGEIYYALSDYKRSIREFDKVFSFSGTNKDDDAQFKIGLCYMNIGQIDKAIIEFNELLDSYPNSEYYVRAKDYINQY